MNNSKTVTTTDELKVGIAQIAPVWLNVTSSN